MNFLEAASLGLLQGLTEFLPVSSSGHLVLAESLWGMPDQQVLFNVIVHLGTLAAVALFVRRELAALVGVFFSSAWLRPGASWRGDPYFRLLIMIVIACLPTAFVGLVFNDWLESLFASPRAAGAALVATGFILFATRHRICREACLPEADPTRALLMGLAQGLAIIPGLSRSGITITAGLFMGLDRNVAARFSFLIFIPAILGALLLELGNASGAGLSFGPALIGFLTAAVSGYAALVWLIRLLSHGKFYLFAPYCWAVGLIALIVS